MARRTSTIIVAVARDVARAQRQAEVNRQSQTKAHGQALRVAEKAHADALRAQERARAAATKQAQQDHRATEKANADAVRAQERAQAAALKQAQQDYLAAREAEAEAQTAAVAARIGELQTVLEQTLDVDDTIAFDSLHIQEAFPPLSLPPTLAMPQVPPQHDAFFVGIKAPGALQKLVPGAQRAYEQAMQAAEASYQKAAQQHAAAEAERQQQRAQFEAAYEQDRKAFMLKVQQRIQEVMALEDAYRAADPTTVETYITMVLERSAYPEGFPQHFRIVYRPEAKECVLEYELPGPEIVPNATEYRYVKARDALEAKPRKPAEIKELYQDVVAAVCLRTIHEVLESDQGQHIALVTFNGCVRTVDPSTGKDVMPCLISLRVARERFDDLNLRRIDKKACLRNLGAQVSSRPEEMQPVKPVVEFDMVDKRFIEQSDLLGSLESRPNLLELTPGQFEQLVSNLFSQMGLDTKLTRASRDGGVDAVAFDTRPIVGGKVVIQAKRYKNTVGVSAVRDLYGTMMNEGANKGILVATSSYGPDAYDFAKDKPVELIDGGGLLYLLSQIGVQARIVIPEGVA